MNLVGGTVLLYVYIALLGGARGHCVDSMVAAGGRVTQGVRYQVPSLIWLHRRRRQEGQLVKGDGTWLLVSSLTPMEECSG